MAKAARAEFFLALMCLIWGATFSVIRESLAATDPYLYLALRFSLALPMAAVLFRRHLKLHDPRLLRSGLLLGLAMTGGFLFQTVGLAYTTASRSGFITAIYIVLVPLLLALKRRRIPAPGVLFAALLAMGGVGLLSGGIEAFRGGGWLGLGESLTLLSGTFFAVQILLSGSLPTPENQWTLHFWQIAVVTVLAWICWLLFGSARILPDTQLLISLLFTGMLGTVVAFAFQLRFQRETSAERAAVVFSLEPVFAAVTAFILLGERLGLVELLGGGLILVALLLSRHTK